MWNNVLKYVFLTRILIITVGTRRRDSHLVSIHAVKQNPSEIQCTERCRRDQFLGKHYTANSRTFLNYMPNPANPNIAIWLICYKRQVHIKMSHLPICLILVGINHFHQNRCKIFLSISIECSIVHETFSWEDHLQDGMAALIYRITWDMLRSNHRILRGRFPTNRRGTSPALLQESTSSICTAT